MPHDFLDFDEQYSDPGGALLASAIDALTLDEILPMHRQALDSVAAGEEDADLWLTTLSLQLALHGKPGRQALWDAIETATPRQLRIMLPVIVFDPGHRTQTRRFFYRLLEHDDPEYVVVGIEGFTVSTDRKARQRVLDLRDHAAPDVRAGVLAYVRGVWHNEALQTMNEAFDDPAVQVRQMAIGLLLDLSIVATSEPVRQALRRQRRPREIRDFARNVLERVENPTDDLTNLAVEAIDYLAEDMGGRLSWKDVEWAEQHWGEDVPTEPLVAMALEHPNHRRLRKRIQELWESDDEWEKSLAISLMAIRADREHEAEILPLRTHESELIYPAAYMFQRMFDPQAAVPALIDLLDHGTVDGKLFAIAALNQIYVTEIDEQLRARLESMRDDPDTKVRELVAFALASEWERRFGKLEVPMPDDLEY